MSVKYLIQNTVFGDETVKKSDYGCCFLVRNSPISKQNAIKLQLHVTKDGRWTLTYQYLIWQVRSFYARPVA